MKKALYIAGIMLFLSACNNNGETGNGADSSNHSSHQGDATASTQSKDTTGLSGQSMMSIMQRNMNQMKDMASTGNPDKDFAAMMKVHHMGAIEMAQLELATGTDAQLKQMAQQMIDEQQKEIAQFDAFLSGQSAEGSDKGFHQEVLSGMNNMKMDMDHSGSVDQQFAQMMIPHHQGAIDMSRAYLKAGGKEEKLKTMTNKIIADQQKEIKELQAWLNNNK